MNINNFLKKVFYSSVLVSCFMFVVKVAKIKKKIFSEKWDPQEKSEVQSKFSIVYEGTLGQEEGFGIIIY